MEANIKNRLAKAFEKLEPSLLGDGNDITFCFLMEDNLKKKLARNSFEVKFFLKKVGFIYFQKVLNGGYDEKIELKLDQLYWPQFLPIKRKCISETITDTINILVKHPDVKRILKFINEENSIRKFLQQFNDYMVQFLNNLLVLQFKLMRNNALKTSYKKRAKRSFFQCQGCGDMCPENRSSMRGMTGAINLMLGRFVYPCCDMSSDSDEDNEDQEVSSDSDVEDEDEEDSSADEIELNQLKKNSKKKIHRKKVLHFTHGLKY